MCEGNPHTWLKIPTVASEKHLPSVYSILHHPITLCNNAPGIYVKRADIWPVLCMAIHANDTAHWEINIWSLLLFSDSGAVVLRMDWEAIYSIEDLLLFFMLVTVLRSFEVYSLFCSLTLMTK